MQQTAQLCLRAVELLQANNQSWGGSTATPDAMLGLVGSLSTASEILRQLEDAEEEEREERRKEEEEMRRREVGGMGKATDGGAAEGARAEAKGEAEERKHEEGEESHWATEALDLLGDAKKAVTAAVSEHQCRLVHEAVETQKDTSFRN